ncbi:MAG: hypothetical protein IPJ81_18675 [Chitinophagaceae bacterium]|nr:hypothetical protein [Chitinophagaceae bacterium]
MAKKNILFVSHKKAQCGVYEFGKNISNVLQHAVKYNFIRIECESLQELNAAVHANNPAAIIYNYHPSVFPWMTSKIAPKFFKNNLGSIRVPQVGIIHEITQKVADTATNYRKKIIPGKVARLCNSLFDYYIAADPTLLLKNPIVFKTGRLIPAYKNNFSLPSIITIGSFGFGTLQKVLKKLYSKYRLNLMKLLSALTFLLQILEIKTG